MKKRLQLGWMLGLVGMVVYFFIAKPTVPQTLDKLDQKYAPSDEFFLQRSFPDASIDLNAYTTALWQAKKSASSRTGNPTFDQLWRTEGPGNLGARVNTIAVHPTRPNIIFAGYSGGGIFRTMDDGKTWKPVFDDQLFLAIGDLVFDPIEPNTIYAGTGDPNISGFPFLGDGLYKSTDLGDNWEYIGLENQRIISKVIIHPTDNQTIYVAAMGLPFTPNANKGLYKTTDGGKSWNQVLFLGDITGVIDVVFDRKDPNILYAAGWDRLRNNQISKTSGQGAKIHKSTDGGATWTQLSGGLPMDDQSRIGLATTSDGVVAVYVDANHHFQGLYKTVDEGNTWYKIISDRVGTGFSSGIFGGFGWYFGKVRVNPNNDEDITVMGVMAERTLDGGKSWYSIHKQSQIRVHPDVHDLVFTNDGQMIMGTDGGLYRFDEDGTNWKDIENIPTTQVYQVAYNPHEPQDYYAGAQDNGTSFGNSSTINDWNKIYGGDGFRTVFHPLNPKVFYAQIQRGVILVTVNGGQSWEVATEGIPDSDRKNWDTPYLMSMHDPNVLFTGTHRVYKTETGPMPVWKAISPDLTNGETRNLSQTISTIHQSSLNPAILYAATTDGNIWRTLDEGANWTKLEGLPKRYFTEVVASPESEQTVFATISGYKDNENTAHIYRSDNQGDTWYSIAGNLPPLAINCLQVIPNQDDQIIFVGTDGGVYGTLNGGASWERVGTNLPIVAAYDLEWNPSENRLVVGTFARSVLSYPLDGIVREDNLSSVNYKEADVQPLTIFPNPALQEISLTFTNERPNKAVILSILDVEGRIVQTTKKPTNRLVNWQVDVSHLMAGQYWVQVQGEVFRYSASFIKL